MPVVTCWGCKMSVRAIDANRDWQFGQSKQSYKKGVEEIGQMIQTRVLSFLGDCFFATDEGIDWLNLLGAGAGKDEAIKRSVSLTILSTSGVTAINSVDLVLNRQTRQLIISYNVVTIYSSSYTGEVGVNV